MRTIFSAFLLCFSLLLSGAVQAQTTLMQVDGVASDDVLNVRSGPGASFEDIGDLRPNEQVIVLVF